MEARRPAPAAGAHVVKYEVLLAGKTRVVEFARVEDDWKISLDGKELDVSVAEVAPNTFSVLLNGQSHQIRVAPRADGTLTLHTGLAQYHAEVTDPTVCRARRHRALEVESRQQMTLPTPV